MIRRIYLYSTYERVWHWSQALGILLLLLSGYELHRPDQLHIFGMQGAAWLHNLLGLLLIINAIFSLFYHVATGEIRQYLRQPDDVFTLAIQQARYYAYGIFRGDPHPFDRSPQRKLNPIQQATYVVILNVLLPLQVITGSMIWGAARYPDSVGRLWSLRLVSLIHTAGAWAFALFVIVHVYMTTTGHHPFSNIKAMITGYEEDERPEPTIQPQAPPEASQQEVR